MSAESRPVVVLASPRARSRESRAAAAASRSRAAAASDSAIRSVAVSPAVTTSRAIAALRSRASRAAAALALACRSDDAWRRSDSARPAIALARSSAVRSVSRASTSSARAVGERLGGGVADLGVRLVVHRLVLGHGELLLGGLQRQQGVGAAGLDGVAALPEALRLGGGRPDGLLVALELRRRGAAAGLGGVLRLLRRLDVGEPRGLLRPGALQRRAQPRQLLLDGLPALDGLVHRRLHVERAGGSARPARRPGGAEHVAVRRDGGEVRVRGDDGAGGVEVVDDDDAVEQPPHGAGERPGDEGVRPPPGRGHARFRKATFLSCAFLNVAFLNLGAHHQGRTAGVAGAEHAQGRHRRVRRLHRHRVGQLAQRGRDRRARLRLHRQQPGDRAEHAVGSVGGQQGAGAVLPGEADRERVHAGAPVRALLLQLALPFGQLRDPGAGARVRVGGLGAALLEAGVAVVEGAEVVAGLRQLGLGGGGALLGLGEGLGQPVDLVGGGGGAAAQGLRAPGECGEPGLAVGERANRGHVGAFGRGERPLVLGALLQHLGEAGPGLGHGRDQLVLLLRDGVGLGVELVGVAAGRALLGVGEVAGALLREPDGAGEPLGQSREPVPGVLGRGQARGVLREGGLQPLLLDARHRELLLDLGPAGAGGGLVGLLARQLVAQGHEVVGGQPEPGVPQLGLHGLRAARDLRLPAQRLELAAQLGRQVGEPGQVGLHRVELAERLLLALAVLEDARGLLDVCPAVLRLGLQHRVELALPDDHVHLAADAGVGEQLLDVEEAAGRAVDLVLARAVAEHPPGDRDLGVLDRQGAVGVVDRERHLGAAERRAAGRTGEDDVLHLAAAQRLGALLAEHPADRVDDVGLARAVRADDTRDPRFQAQRRGRGEGLEALQRQALEVHGGNSTGQAIGEDYLRDRGDPCRQPGTRPVVWATCSPTVPAASPRWTTGCGNRGARSPSAFA